jgi:serine/threonine protein phosphatase PrpC
MNNGTLEPHRELGRGVQVYSGGGAVPYSDQDRILIRPHRDGALLVLADGSAGFSGGREAAEMAVAFFECWAAEYAGAPTPEGLVSALRSLDCEIGLDLYAGETTCVVAVAGEEGLTGASVGDSGALLIGPDSVRDLTARQHRKPRLGSAAARPVGFTYREPEGVLLLASDGLLDYSTHDRIAGIVRAHEPAEAVAALIESVRLRSGELPDDVSVVVAVLTDDV